MFILLFLFIIAGISFLYLLIGINQLVAGNKEKNALKKRSGSIAVFVSLIILIIIVYFYLKAMVFY